MLNYTHSDPLIRANLSNSFSIYITVYNNPGLEIKNADLPERVLGSGRSSLYIEYENPGTVDFKNISLIIEGNIEEQQKVQTLSILKAGRSNSIEYALQFTEPGINEIVIYLTYEDNNGKTYQTPVVARQTMVETDIYGDLEIVPENTSPAEESFLRSIMNNSAFLAMILTAAIIVAVLVILITLRVRRWIARKKWYFKDDKK